MTFDKKKFLKSEFVPREEKISLPDLKEFFGEESEPSWTVRGLTGHELGRVNEAVERNKNVAAILEALVSASAKDKAEGVKKLIGLGDEVPSDIARRLELLVAGSVDPECDMELAVKICTNFPIEFFQLTNAITRITGRGYEVKKKQKSSTETPASAMP